jgi:uncharacterized protein with gpF-like domain
VIGMALHEFFDPSFALDARPIAKEKPLRPIRPNAGIRIAYQRQLDALIDEMQRSMAYWVKAAFRAAPSAVALLAQDDLGSATLQAAIARLRKRWLKNFDKAAKKLAEYFVKSTAKRTDAALRKILKDSGFAIDFKLTAAQRDVLGATVQENVALIKSIPQHYFTQIEGAVMRSVATGRDLKQLNGDLLKIGGVTKRRAKFIALDQSNKATANLTRVRQLEVAGADAEAIWVHSQAGKEPRPTHLKAGRDQTRYKVSEGWLDPAVGKRIFPGELPNCRCFSRLVVKGFT